MDSSSQEEYSRQASRYCTNLNGLVDRDTSRLFRGDRTRVYRGTFRPKGTEASDVIQVAIKSVWSASQGDGSIEDVLQEVHLWSKLHHANITKLLGFVTEFDSAFSMVSEWMPKGNAYQYVQDQDVDPRPLLLDIANGLVYLHTHESGPIYHGGLKGFNVLISDDGRALLTGFGSACSSSSSFCVTYPAVYGGLLQHSPPESLSNEDYEPSAAGDIWSFGMTALELFTRMPPFHTKRTVQSLFLRILRGPPDRPSDDATCFRLSNEWWDICMSCWKTESAFRPNASDIVKKIGQINNTHKVSLHSKMRKLIPLSEIEPRDIVILVVGTTGSGMSNFINKLTGTVAESEAHRLGSCTKNIEAYAYERNGNRFVFVDTPGFNSSQSQNIVFRKIGHFLETTYRSAIKLTGIIYTYRIIDAHISGAELSSLGLFAAACGGEAAHRVRLVTTMWDEADMESARETERTLKTWRWKSLLDAGARYEQFHNTRDSAWEIVLRLGDSMKALLLQRELVDLKMELTKTTAGKQLVLGITKDRPSFPYNPRETIQISEIRDTDVVILVLGSTGSGMSNFINKFTGMPPESGTFSLGSSTMEVKSYAYDRGGKRFVFVDTPGFNSSQTYSEVLRKITEWLESTYRSSIVLTGVLYLYRIMDDHVSGPELTSLKILASLCGAEAADRIRLVTAMWDGMDAVSAERTEEKMKTGPWKLLIEAGSRHERFHNTRDSAWEIVLGLGNSRKALLVQRELVDMQMELTQTTAGKQILLGITQDTPSFPRNPRSTIQIFEMKPTDIVILVLGTTGSGMSNFINKLTGMPAERGTHTLGSCTTGVKAYLCDHGGKRFIFVDTPGFNSSQTPTEVLTKIINWLRISYRNRIEPTGIIYTYRINDTHESSAELTGLRLAAALCGNEAADRMRLVTTMWDDVDTELAQDTEDRMKDDVWESLLSAGSRYERFYNTGDSAWNIVLGLGDARKALLIQREVVDMKMELAQTNVGKRLQFQGIIQSRPSFPSYPRAEMPVSEIQPNDIVILFLGTTGSGMSNFINTLTGMREEYEADRLGSCTEDVNAYAYGRDGRRYIFVDTPGFNSSQSQHAVVRKIATWLESAYKCSINLAGIIYMYRIIDAYIPHAELTSLGIFAALCGVEVAGQVRLVTTMWDEVDVGSAQETEDAIKGGPWELLLDAGCRCERFDNTRESAWRIILGLGDDRKALLFQRERVDAGMDIAQTTVGKQVLLGIAQDKPTFPQGSPPVVQTSEIKSTDTVVLVLGTTGSGISNFINKLTGIPAESGTHGLRSSTIDVRAYACERGGNRFIFVDTPGFNSSQSQNVVLGKIAHWLETTYRNSIMLAGIIYTYPIIDAHLLSAAELATLQTFTAACGYEMADQVRLVTTMWDKANGDCAKDTEDRIKAGVWKLLLDSGSRYERFNNTQESAWEIVLGLGDSRKALLLQRELVDIGRELTQTIASRQLFQGATQDKSLLSNNRQPTIQISELSPTDVVILVLGTTGSGTTNFIDKLTGMPPESAMQSLRSCSMGVRAYAYNRGGKRFIFVDTPGFDSLQSRDVILRKVTYWLEISYRGSIRLTGIIYIRRITDTSIPDMELSIFQTFTSLCGEEVADRVRLVTTMWDEADTETAKNTEEILKAGPWKSFLDAGACYERFENTGESAWKVVLGLGDNRNALLIQRELVDIGMEFRVTTVARKLLQEATLENPRPTIQISEIEPSDMVIMFLGSTCSGMSNFINKLTGMPPECVAHSHGSCTIDVKAYACDRDGKRFIFVDTPGFNSSQSQNVVLKKIAYWLETAHTKSIKLIGVVYTQRITDAHVTHAELTSLRTFATLCGNEVASQVRLVTTMWDQANVASAEKREDVMKAELWKALLDAGACYERFHNTEGSAWDIVLRLGDSKRTILLQRELAVMGMDLTQTTAGRQLLPGTSHDVPSFPHNQRPVIHICEIKPTDILILVLGTTGSGMSNFINNLTGMPAEVATHTLGSCTIDVAAYLSHHDGQRYIFVDTPGLNNMQQSEREVLGKIEEWLRAAYRRPLQVTGVIYTRRITDDDRSGAEGRSFQMFAHWCGSEAADRVRLVTTMWDEVDAESDANSMENRLKVTHWNSLLNAGARYVRFDNTPESAWNIVLGIGDTGKPILLKGLYDLRKQLAIKMSEVVASDIVIIVMGTTGTGMSHFIDKLTGMQPEEGPEQLVSYKRGIRAYACHYGRRRFVFVDTPGFTNTSLWQGAVLRKIVDWLGTIYRRSITLTGVIYTHSISDTHDSGTNQSSFRIFSDLCGAEAADRVRLVTTMWDDADVESAEALENTLQDGSWKSLLHAGACYQRFQNTTQSAWEIVLGLGDTKKTLLVQKELVDMRMKLEQTTSGRHLVFIKTKAPRRLGLRRRFRGLY